MKRILGFIFLLSILTSCQVSTSQTTITTDNIDQKSKANVTFGEQVNEGICINCNQYIDN